MTLVKFNLNQNIRVVFRPEAQHALRNYCRLCTRIHENVDDVIEELFPNWRDGKQQRMQAWKFMEIFGPYTHIGTPPFETEIELEIE